VSRDVVFKIVQVFFTRHESSILSCHAFSSMIDGMAVLKVRVSDRQW